MAITLSRALAATYFGASSHLNYGVWFAFSDEQQDAAIAHATRLITRALGTEVTNETTDTPSSYRPDYAVYEQAFFMLANSTAIVDGTQTGPKFVSDDGTGQPRERRDVFTICREAQRWLNASAGAGVQIARGA
ncbi:MAG: hypothetical protein OEN49_06880 [Gammaproteobacteria bacterium]|nr:hypothetical protein [Gammaproteobacteria bacterium]